MKKHVSVLIASLFFGWCSLGQGTIDILPVPVTNGLTGALADSSIVAALYLGPAGATEITLLINGPASPLVNGYAQFGTVILNPVVAPGANALFQVRAWSAGFSTYETALASGNPDVLAGKSVVLVGTVGNPVPPPLPSILNFPGFTVTPVPEPSLILLMAFGAGAIWWLRRAR